MKIDILQGKWTELKDEIQRNWSQLTNDELESTQGSIKAMTGLLEERYGKLRKEGQSKLSRIWNKFVPPGTVGPTTEIPVKNPVAASVAGTIANEESPAHDDSPMVRTGSGKRLESARPRSKKLSPSSSPTKEI